MITGPAGWIHGPWKYTFCIQTSGDERMAEFLKEHWSVITSTPLTFILLALIVGSGVFAFTKTVLGGALEAARERLKGAKEEIARLKDHREQLVNRLETLGENIDDIKTSLAAAPKIHVSEDLPPPGFGKDGDLWLKILKK